MEAIVAPEAQGAFPAIQDARRKIVFFKPVDNNMAYQTFLGTGMKTNFDFVTQAFSIVDSQANKVTHSVNQVRIGAPSGPPLAMKLSDVPYSICQRSLPSGMLERLDTMSKQKVKCTLANRQQQLLAFSLNSLLQLRLFDLHITQHLDRWLVYLYTYNIRIIIGIFIQYCIVLAIAHTHNIYI